MKTIILCNRLDRLTANLGKTEEPLRYLNLMDNQQGFRICDFLRSRAGAEELSRPRLLRERNEDFRKKYTELLGRLNTANHSLHWWAMSFTNKNPYTPSLCRDTAYFLLVAEMTRSSPLLFLVITDSVDLTLQVQAWAKGEGFNAINLVRGTGGLRRFLKRYTPAGIIKAALRVFGLWLFSRRFNLNSNKADEHLVIVTHTHPRSYTAPNSYRDTYFGALVDQLAGTEISVKALVLGLVLERPREQFRKLKALNFGLPVLPLESWMTVRDIAACTFQALKSYFLPVRLAENPEIDGLDLTVLVDGAVKEARGTGDLLLNLHVYYCAKWLAQTVKVTRCLYPFENRAWEKMLVMGLRSASPHTQIVGYQHTSITPSHTNFLLGDGEADAAPLPDLILTTGEVTKERLEKEGKYPPGMFKTACALRHGQTLELPARERRASLTRILVPLATSLEEYINSFLFLEEAFAGHYGFELRIRPHPSLIPLEPALEIAPLNRRDFYSESTGSIDDELGWADVVVYVSSTVGLEAVSLGIPAVYMDLGDFLNTDPMFGWEVFKWTVKEPSELVCAFRQIDALPDDEFRERQRKSREYAESYLRPVTAEGLAVFWETTA